MFRHLVRQLGAGVANANGILAGFTSNELGAYLELLWNQPRSNVRAWSLPAVQLPGAPGALVVHQQMARAAIPGIVPPANPAVVIGPTYWPHIIFAYLVENTGIVEIMRRVLIDWLNDERLPFASLETQYWMRATEDLFFTTPSPFFHSLGSSLRSDPRQIRENAYQRLLGFDLAFRRDPQSGPTYYHARIANLEFARTLERLLFEVWRGFINRLNGVGENRTDVQAIERLVRELRQMLMARRTNGTLLREEFAAVSMMSWLFLTIEYNTFIVANLNAQSTSAENRLRKIAALVGMQPARATDAYLHLADALSAILVMIETGLVEAAGVDILYDPAVNQPVTQAMQRIIGHWEQATGHAIKEALSVRPAAITVPPMPMPSVPPAAKQTSAPVSRIAQLESELV